MHKSSILQQRVDAKKKDKSELCNRNYLNVFYTDPFRKKYLKKILKQDIVHLSSQMNMIYLK